MLIFVIHASLVYRSVVCIFRMYYTTILGEGHNMLGRAGEWRASVTYLSAYAPFWTLFPYFVLYSTYYGVPLLCLATRSVVIAAFRGYATASMQLAHGSRRFISFACRGDFAMEPIWLQSVGVMKCISITCSRRQASLKVF
jgi:hypothetical protein